MYNQGLSNDAVFRHKKEKATDSAFLLSKPQFIHDRVCLWLLNSYHPTHFLYNMQKGEWFWS